MKLKRLICTLAAVALVLCTALGTYAAGEDEAWWEQEYWSTEQLLSLGAVPPDYNAELERYEISSAEQLLFMTGEWKDGDTNSDGVQDAPRDATYVLMNDIDMAPLMLSLGDAITAASGVNTEGYMPPISANKENSENPYDGYFMGTFDGQGHAVKNLRVVRLSGEYAGMFGYIGYKTAEKHAYVRNLAVIDIEVIGVEDCGTLSGGCYADVDNVLVVGSVTAECGVGGFTSSVKSGGGDNVGHVNNCFVLSDVNCEDEETGGLASKIAGMVTNCFVAGSISSDSAIQYAGGLAGVYDAGEGVENNAVFHSGITTEEASSYVGGLFGSLDGDSGRTIKNNLVWSGMALTGNPDYSHPEKASQTYADYGELSAKAAYTDTLGWDFDSVWTWVGDEADGYPMLASFAELAQEIGIGDRLAGTIEGSAPALRADNPPLTAADADTQTVISAVFTPSVSGGEIAEEVTLYYGTQEDGNTFTDSVPMDAGDNGAYSCTFPTSAQGEYYYYIAAKCNGKELTFPYDIAESVPLALTVPVIDGTPRDISVSPGTDATKAGFNFLTNTDALAGQIRLRKAGESEWSVIDCTSYVSFIEEGWDECVSHWADAEGLTPGAEYEYQAVGLVGDQAFEGEIISFTALPDDKTLSVMFFSDMQAEDEEGYVPFASTYSEFVLPNLGEPDLLLSTGDNVEDSFKTAQWDMMFDVCGDAFATVPSVLLPGNHEYSGDLFYKNFTARTNLPGGMDDEVIGEYTGYMCAGDICFVFINSEIYTENGTDDRAAYYELQKEWAREIFEQSGCRWRVIATHRGPYTTNHNGLEEVPEVMDICNELCVDLLLNGHDHSYIRVTAKDGVKLEPGQATTYLTTSPLGMKTDDYVEGLIDDLVAVRAGSADSVRQKFGFLTADAQGLHVTIYERGEEEDYSNYAVIDSFDIAEPLSAAAAGKTDGSAAPADEEDAKKPFPVALILIIAIVVIIAIAAAVLLRKKTVKDEQKEAAAGTENENGAE